MSYYLLRIIGLVGLAGLGLYGLWLGVVSGGEGRQRWVLGGLRLGALMVVFLMIVNPVLRREALVQEKPGLVLLVDRSDSMRLLGEGGRPRFEEVERALAGESVREALKSFEVRRLWFAEGLVEKGTGGEQTDLGLALRQVEAMGRAAQVVVISDGAQTRGDMVLAVREGEVGTVSAVGVGKVEAPMDLGPVVVQAPRVVRENEEFDLGVRVGSTQIEGEARVEVERDGKVVRAVGVRLGKEPGKGQVRMPGMAAGFHVVTAKVAARAGEATAANNVRSVMVEARRDKTKVVFVAGAPSPDYAAIKRVVAKLPRTELDFWARVARGEYLHETGGKVTREGLDLARAMKGRQVVVLMNIEAGEWRKTLEEFVLGGGALGVLAGKRTGSALDGILPVGVGNYREVPVGVAGPVGATALGAELARGTGAQWWAGAPYLAGQVGTEGLRVGAEVVLRGNDGTPLLLTRRVGEGRTLVFAGDGTSRWLLSAEADEDSRKLHEVLWQTVVGWLGSLREERQVLLMLDPPVAQFGQPVRALVQVSRGLEAATGARVTVSVKGRGMDQRLAAGATAVAGRYQAALADLPAGEYVVRAEAAGLGSEERRLVVEPGGAEVAKLTLQEGRLQALAEAGGGRYARLGGLAELLEGLPQEEVRRREVVARRPLRSWGWFLVVLGLCTAEWVLRRRWGW